MYQNFSANETVFSYFATFPNYFAFLDKTRKLRMTADHFTGIEAICQSQFWAINGTFTNGSALPNFTLCFQHTVLIFIPCCFFWILFPVFLIQIRQLRKRKDLPLHWSLLLCVKFVLTEVLLLLAIFLFAKAVYEKILYEPDPPIHFIHPTLLIVTLVGISACMVLAKKYGMVTSGILHLTWILFMICGAPELYGVIQLLPKHRTLPDVEIARCVVYLIWYPIIIMQAFLFSFADPRHQWITRLRKKFHRSPELDSSFLNRLTLWWFNAIPVLGSRKDLEVNDLYQLNEGSTSAYLVPKWESFWQPAMRKYEDKKLRKFAEESVAYRQKVSRCSAIVQDISEVRFETSSTAVPPPSIVWRLFLMFKYDILSAAGTKACSDMLQFASPFLLNKLIGFISDTSTPLWLGVGFAIAMFTCSEIRSFLINYYFYLMFRIGIKIQTTLTAAVYKKTLKLTNAARRNKTVGEIVNLMAIDVERFQLITPHIQQIWSCPFQITLALIYLFYTLGASAICGVIVMVLFLPLNIVGSVIVKRWQMQQMKLKDERSKMCNEVLNGIKVIKLYAWEPPMEETIEKIREKELKLIRKAGFVKAVIDAFNTASPFFVAFLTFLTYTLSDPSHILTPQIAFVSLTLFNQLRSPMTMIAYLIQLTVQALVANKRLKEFLVAEELNEMAIDRAPQRKDENTEQTAIEVRNATFAWEANDISALTSMVTEINLKVPKGRLLAVVGKVGCGKSSLLNALLGEMEKLRGYVGVHGRLAYVPQQPWIRNLTLRENITFGKRFDEKFYNSVVHACALRPDIAILPQGDSTEIGEKGINLSGGQKARVSLARAVYQNYDVYLLDDPLSAVDSHVGKHIFNKVLGPHGLLKHKTRILVTHGMTYIKEADEIAVMNDGKIAEIGKFDTLIENCGEFAEFMEECQRESERQQKEEEERARKRAELEEPVENNPEVLYSDFDEDTDTFEPEEMTVEFQRSCSTISELEKDALRRYSLSRSASKASRKSSRRRSSAKRKSESVVMNGKGSKAAQLIVKEHTETGRVKFGVYIQYMQSATFIMFSLFVIFFTSYAAFQLGRGIWLSQWSNANAKETKEPDQMSLGARLGVYAAFGCVEGLGFFLSQIFLVISGINASRHLHTPFLHNLLRSPMSFFDTTPIGRILNRFGKDIDVIDQLLPVNFRYFVMCILNVITTLTIIVISTPIFASVILPLAILYYFSLRFYVPTSRQMKRLESVNRSPIYSHFGETIQGASSIRAFGKVDEFCESSEKQVDVFIRCKYLNLIANRWLAIRLEFVGNCVVLFAALFAVLSRQWGITAGVVGLSISYALNITETLNFAVRQISELETNIVAVERVKEYAETPTEAPWRVEGLNLVKGWPKNGSIQLRDYSTRYREGLDFVVRKLNASIESAEKVGIVGRTGAGKSSLALALFRMVEAVEGEILIDGTNIAELGLHDLRSNLTIIPQDPVLFSGTLRFNLDPFGLYDDHDIWSALELAHLKSFAAGLADGLNHIISEGGENISVGQRQLVCLARALLRKSKVLILDEATAAVDLGTDALIQETIRREFKSSTVLTIAHRLNTILDYDRVMVLDKGRIYEFDSPQRLLANQFSAFYAMAKDANIIA